MSDYIPLRFKQRRRHRPRGWILFSQLPRSPKADAVREDILDRPAQHQREGTLPRGGYGLFYYLRPHGIAGNPRGITYIKETDRQIRDEGWGEMEAGGKYVTDLLKLMRRVWNPETREWLRVREELDRKRRQQRRCCSCTKWRFDACWLCRAHNPVCHHR